MLILNVVLMTALSELPIEPSVTAVDNTEPEFVNFDVSVVGKIDEFLAER